MKYCICGHLESEHCILGMNDLPYACNVRRNSGAYIDNCQQFKLDNLKYLEECYDRTKNLA